LLAAISLRCIRFLGNIDAPMVKSGRLPEIDALRGLAIVLMALDHTRDYFGDHSIDALDLAHTHIALFFARWLTHFCAPTFVCLAGMSVALAAHRHPVNRPFLVWPRHPWPLAGHTRTNAASAGILISITTI
jgi:uncharacterized membrane protein